MWERYLGEEGEIESAGEASSTQAATDSEATARAFAGHPKIRRVTAWLRAELAAASRAERYGMARLVRVDFRQIGRPGEGLPSLENFAASEGLDGFSQAEQLDAYRARFGKALELETKRAKLMRQQLEAVDAPAATGARKRSACCRPTMTTKPCAPGAAAWRPCRARLTGCRRYRTHNAPTAKEPSGTCYGPS